MEICRTYGTMSDAARPAPRIDETDASLLEKLRLPETIVVTSGSAIKITAVEKALQQLFPNRAFVVKGIKAASGINEQPVGEETEQGARNRIEDAKNIFSKDEPHTEAVFVSIENGIFQNGDAWDDRAVAVIALPDGASFGSVSEGVRFPAEDVREAMAREGGFEKHTVGSVIADRFAAEGVAIDKQDPQSALTKGAFTREQQIIGAIADAFVKAAKAQA